MNEEVHSKGIAGVRVEYLLQKLPKTKHLRAHQVWATLKFSTSIHTFSNDEIYSLRPSGWTRHRAKASGDTRDVSL